MRLLPLISLPPPEGMEGETGLGNNTEAGTGKFFWSGWGKGL